MSSRVIVSLLALPLILFWICSTTDAGHGDLCVTDSNCTELDDNSTCRFSQSCDSTASCTGVCACVEGFTHVNGSCVKIRLGDPCTSNTSCNSSVENSACVNGTCECGGEYVMKHENVCSVRLLGDKCLKTADCNATVMYSQCHKQTKICRCPRFFVQVNNNTCKPVVDAPCSSDEMCMSIPNATCSKCPTSQPCVRRCQCFDGFTKVNGSCVKLKIGDGCELFPGKNCSQTISNSECKNETCQCSGGYKHRQDVCLLRVVGDNCSHNEDCEAAVDRSFCNSSSSTCQCLQGYISRGSGVACDRVKIGDQCKSHEDCNKSVRNSRCTDNFCICLKDYSSNRNKTHCLERLLGDPCEDETSCANVKESTCNQTCVCRPGFKPNSRRRCEKRQLGDLCTSHLDCANACGGNACACTSGKCSKAALEETNCSTNYDCMELFNNSFCDNSTCHCNVNLAPDPAFQKCVFYNLGHVCSETKNRCEYSVNNSVCFNKTCQCKDTHYPMNNSICSIKQIGGLKCESNTQCKVNNSFCEMNNTCKCKVGYRQEGFDACVLASLYDECTKPEDCNTTILHSDCDHGRCRCLPGYTPNITTTTSSCEMRTLGSGCKHSFDCSSVIENSVCVQCGPNTSDPQTCLTCQCKAGYIAKDASPNSTGRWLCVSRSLGDPCHDDSSCADIENSACQNTCVCQPGYVGVGRRRCSRRESGIRTLHEGIFSTPPHHYKSVLIAPPTPYKDILSTLPTPYMDILSTPPTPYKEIISHPPTPYKEILSTPPTPYKETISPPPTPYKEIISILSTPNMDIISASSPLYKDFLLSPPRAYLYQNKHPLSNDEHARRPRAVTPRALVTAPTRPLMTGAACSTHQDCTGMCYAPICACSRGTCFDAALGEMECESDVDCTVANSVCRQQSCTCDEGYSEMDVYTCRFYHLGDGCYDNSLCANSVMHSMCVSFKCQCQDTYYQDDAKTCLLKGTGCSSDSQCEKQFLHSFCDVDGACQCVIGYRKNAVGACAPVGLGDRCVSQEECNVTNPHSECFFNTCVCVPGYSPKHSDQLVPGQATCLPTTLGDACTSSQDCSLTIPNSYCGVCDQTSPDPLCVDACRRLMHVSSLPTNCSLNACLCKDGFLEMAGNQCAPRVLSDPCTNDSDCSVHVPNAVCVSKRCRCGGGYLQTRNNTFCPRKKIGDFCYTGPNDDCSKAVDNSVCTRNGTKAICLCKSGYQVDASMTLCRRRRIREQTCAVDLDCRDAVNMSHCASGVCVCDHGYATNLDRDACHRMRLHTDTCTAESECSTAVDYSTCVNGKCACVSGFYSENNNTGCLKRKIGIGKCDVHVDCSDAVNNSECRGLCRCMSGYMTRNDDATTCHRRVIYDNCTLDTDCSDAVADTICRGRRCVCSLGFYASADNTTCIKRKLGDRCSFNLDCQMVTGSSGCANGTCVCSQGYDGHANSTQCVKAPERLGSECEYDEQCSTRFPSSIGHSTCSPATLTCVCPNGTFVSRDAKACVKLPQKIGDYCADDTHCSRMANNTICNTTSMTSWCQCASGYFLDNNSSACHKLPTALGDVCNQNEQCSVNITHSSCERGVCTCRYGYERKNTDNRCTERYKHKLEPFDVPRAINCSTTNPTPCNSWNSSICDAQAGECRCKHRSALKDNKTCVSVQTYKITLNFTSILLLSNDPYDYFPFNYSENYGNSSHPEYKKLAARITELGLKNMFNSSKHRDRYVSSEVVSLDPSSNTGTGVLATVLLHLTPLAEDYTNVTKLAEIIQMFTSDFQANSKESVLGKSLIKVKMPFNSAHVADYNECSSKERNDCDVNANCLNTLGSFMCVCKPMYDDMAEKHNIHTRGRVCKLPSDDRKQGSDVCSSDHCTIKWEYVAWALTLFLLLILAFITYEIFQRKEDFSARKLYEKFGTTKIRKLRQASMRRLQESKRKKQEESKLKKEELKRKKEESKKKKEEEKKQKTEGKSTKVKKGKKKTDADVEDVEEIPEPGLVEIIYPPSIPFAGSESVDVDITNLPGNMDITIDRQSVIEESSV